MGSRKWRRRMLRWLPWLVLLALAGALAVQFFWIDRRDVRVYASADPEIVEPMLGDVTALLRMKIDRRYGLQSSRAANLPQIILAEARHPRCDVFWNDEFLQTLRLARLGAFEPHESPNVAEFPEAYRASGKLWQAFALRARVLLVDTRDVDRARWPRSIRDLTGAAWRSRCAMARPISGAAAVHAACLVALWGEDQARKFFRQLRENGVQMLASEREVALAVARGEASCGLVDSDQAAIEQLSHVWLEIIYPDQGEGDPGTLYLPNTLSIVRGCRHPEAARRLVDQLLTARAATVLAKGAGAVAPLNTKAKVKQTRLQTPPKVRPMDVDFEAALRSFDAAMRIVSEEFPE